MNVEFGGMAAAGEGKGGSAHGRKRKGRGGAQGKVDMQMSGKKPGKRRRAGGGKEVQGRASLDGKTVPKPEHPKGPANPRQGGAVGANWEQMRAKVSQKRARVKGLQRVAGARGSADHENGEGGLLGGAPRALSESREMTRTVAMDCEMVGLGSGGQRSALARVCIINNYGSVLLDEFCRPSERVTDFRTEVSGIRPADLQDAAAFETVQEKVRELLRGRTLVGHALSNDLRALQLKHPKLAVRDTARYAPFRVTLPSGRVRPRALRELAAEQLGLEIQHGEHSPIEDARAALYLYHKHRQRWETSALESKEGKGKRVALEKGLPSHHDHSSLGAAGYAEGMVTLE